VIVLYDSTGRAIVRRQQFGFLRTPVEYIPQDPPAADVELCDAIGSHTVEPDDDGGEGPTTE
jgi:hypothetical protein